MRETQPDCRAGLNVAGATEMKSFLPDILRTVPIGGQTTWTGRLRPQHREVTCIEDLIAALELFLSSLVQDEMRCSDYRSRETSCGSWCCKWEPSQQIECNDKMVLACARGKESLVDQSNLHVG